MEGVAYVKNFAGTGIWLSCSFIFNKGLGPLLVHHGWAHSSGQYSVGPDSNCFSRRQKLRESWREKTIFKNFWKTFETNMF